MFFITKVSSFTNQQSITKTVLLKNRLKTKKIVTAWLAVSIFTLVLISGCAAPVRTANHVFSFDVLRESPGIELLDYSYGTSGVGPTTPGSKNSEGKIRQSGIIGGGIQVGEYLYVKWKINSSGEVFEDRVNLRNLLPNDMEGFQIHFVVEGKALEIFLVSPTPKPANYPIVGPAKFGSQIVRLIYRNTK